MSDNPLEGFGGMFGDIFSMLGQQGPNAWFDTATQLALNIARGEDGDPNPLPPERQRLEELSPLIGRHVDALFGVPSDPVVTAVNRTALTQAELAQWRPHLEANVTTPPVISSELAEANPMMAQMTQALGPLFAGFQIGSVAGHFSERAWSLAVLPLPRTNNDRLLVVNNLKQFAEDWSLDRDQVYCFATAQEFVASLVLSQPGVGDALRALLIDTVKESTQAQGDIMSKLTSMINPEDMASMMGNPEALLEGIETVSYTHLTLPTILRV